MHMMKRRQWLLAVVFSLLPGPWLVGAEPEGITRKEVIYGRKDGMALTMDIITPKTPKGLGVVWVVSGGWFSSHDAIRPEAVAALLERGYTVFAAVHGSQPRYTIPDAIADMNRAVRFIRFHAKEYGIDPDRIGVTGGSAGGHLSLMLGTAGDAGNPKAPDPVDRTSSRVQAVACFFPPSDFLNYGSEGNVVLGDKVLSGFKAPFDFRELDPETRSYVAITDPTRVLEIGRAISPVYHVTKDDPPTLIIHGDADKLVPIQQAERIVARLKEVGVPAELVVKKGQAHGWPNLAADIATFADWFDKQLGHRAPPAK